MKKLNMGVYGGTGFTGGELCRLLLNHPYVEKIRPTSRDIEPFENIHPNLKHSGLSFVKPKTLEEMAGELDAVFLCLPSGKSMGVAGRFLDKDTKVIDLGSDFRFTSLDTYEAVYGKKHTSPNLSHEAVYGVSEINREKIKKASLIANPGCYVITGLLGLFPVIKEEIINIENIPINAINGMTGADSKPRIDTMQTRVSSNILSYNMEGHRHSSEFEEKISEISGKQAFVNFNAAHGDFTTGIHCVASPLIKSTYKNQINREGLIDLYKRYYGEEFFVRVNDLSKSAKGTSKVYDVYPQMRNVQGTNFCDIGLDYDSSRGIVKIISVADNLVRGSGGSAIQNMNLMFGFDETAGLKLYSAP
jgi:N-acetyl-gamma-glutamyl-phosphate reductase common form